MTGRQPASDAPESYHRRWLHALEEEATVPSDEMQLARVYADYAPASGGRATRVSARTMRKHTHMSFDAISSHTKWLVDHGWLILQGEAANGERKTYNLALGSGGERREPVKDPEGRRDERRREANKRKREASVSESPEPPDRSDSRNGQVAANRSDTRNGKGAGDRSGGRNGTVPPPGTPPFRKPEREQKEQKEQKDLSARATAARRVLKAASDATEREIDLFITQVETEHSPDRIDRYIASYPDTTIVSKIGAIRTGAATAAPRAAHSDDTPTPPPRAEQCGWCSRTGHGADDCPDREPQLPPASAAPPSAVVERCLAGKRCQRPPGPIGEDGHHELCSTLANLRAGLAVRAAAPPSADRLAAEQVAGAVAGRDRAAAGALPDAFADAPPAVKAFLRQFSGVPESPDGGRAA